MKVINQVGVSVRIKENGIERVIPFDHQQYIIDDSCYEVYKDLFQIVKPPISLEIKTKQEKRNKEKLKILHGKKVRSELRYKSILLDTRKPTKKRLWRWNFVSPEGKRFENVDIKEWCKINSWQQPNLYKRFETGKLYRGWKIERFEKL